MAILPNKANVAGNTEKMNDFSPVPVGKYPAILVKSEYKANKAGTGHGLNLQYKIIDGEHRGRVFFDLLNLDNPNQTTVQIANKSLNSLCAACGKVGVEDSDELHGIPVLVTLGMTKATPAYPAKNKVTFIEEYTGTATYDGPTESKAAAPPWAGKKAEVTPTQEKAAPPWVKAQQSNED